MFNLLISSHSDPSSIGGPSVPESSDDGMYETGASAVVGAIREQPEKLYQIKFPI